MNTKHITAAVVLLAAAGAALAQAPQHPSVQIEPTKSRAEVLGELQQARAKGLITNTNNYPILVQKGSPASRAQVINELQQARAQGLITNNNNYPIVVQAGVPLTREQVKAELQQPSFNSALYSGA